MLLNVLENWKFILKYYFSIIDSQEIEHSYIDSKESDYSYINPLESEYSYIDP